MRHFLLGMLLVGAGCFSPAPPPPPAAPLTLDEWKTLPVAEKYTIETFERLRDGDPKLREPRAWDKFTRDVILPEKKRDGVASPKL